MMIDKETFYRGLPTKRMGAGALFFDEQGFVLVVKPTYKAGWEIPGGVVELNESPSATVVREIEEELGLRIAPSSLSLLALDYMAGNGPKTEALMFVFSGGVLGKEQQACITLKNDELDSFRFIDRRDIFSFLNNVVAERVARALDSLDSNQFAYHEGYY